ncbi:MAG TPA: tol-pal system protein YbgF [Spongiibacteraceae bacterium]|jgi:tol-pal system protein YbgF
MRKLFPCIFLLSLFIELVGINTAIADSFSTSNEIASPSLNSSAVVETAKPEEYDAYQTAYAKLKRQDYEGAIKAYSAFITAYPASALSSNSYFWLGKAYETQNDLNNAQQAYEKVVSDYPQSNKTPDALYALGKVYFLKGDKTKAKATLQQVIDNYGTGDGGAPQAARQFIQTKF